MVRDRLATLGMSLARSFGRALGCELVVDCSEHSLEIAMEVPGESGRAWDHDLYRKGQMYYQGYANPFKPVIDPSNTRGEHDQMDVEESEDASGGASSDDESGGSDAEIGMMPSSRYRQYLDQHLISELVRPEERWKLLVYGILFIGFLQMATIIVIMFVTG